MLTLALFFSSEAGAGQLVSGDYIQVYYSDYGAWNWSSYSAGLQIRSSTASSWVDVTYPGSPWSDFHVEYYVGSTNYEYYTNTTTSTTLSLTAETNLSSGSTNKAYYAYTAGSLTVTKTETWNDADSYMYVEFTVTNGSSSTMTDLRIALATDPDHGVAGGYGTTTYNDTQDRDSDGYYEWLQAADGGGRTFGFATCLLGDELGIANWVSDADVSMTDQGGAGYDYTMHYRHRITSLAAGASEKFGFVVAQGSSATAASSAATSGQSAYCASVCDQDGDGSKNSKCKASGYDCDDTDSGVYPGAAETCDGEDDDCDGSTDEGVTSTYYRDADSDGYGTSSTSTAACSAPSGYVSNSTDCLDSRAASYPGATEACNSYDDDCDGSTDEGVTSTYYRDADSDGYGTSSTTTTGCSAPSGYVGNSTDCLDSRAASYPGATESCNSYDDDCDGSTDEGVTTTYYRDADSDGYGTSSTSTAACSAPSGYVGSSTDCLDSRAASYPGATEYCNGYDDDCDSTVDESTAADAATWYDDDDADGYGDLMDWTVSCASPSGYVAGSTDCDDTRAASNPAATEYCNTYDDDCDGTVDESSAADAATWYADDDGDGYGDVSDSEVSCSAPADHVADTTDCDDSLASVNPAGTEVCNDIDDDCDGSTDEDATDWTTWYEDADDDGYGTSSMSVESCDQPSGYVEVDGDCDDTDSTSYPTASQLPDGVDNDCSGIADDGIDTDEDGLNDDVEGGLGTDPYDDDSDDDGLIDGDEVDTYETDPMDADSDDGGVDDGTEIGDGTDPNDGVDDGATYDPDEDGLTNAEEVAEGTDAGDPDSDDDGLLDGEEVHEHETDPNDADSDDGGIDDGTEVGDGTDPNAEGDDDPDDDGLDNAGEDAAGSDRADEDSDDDGLLDGAEVNDHGTDPTAADTDQGGVPDGDEVADGTDPNDEGDDDPDADGLPNAGEDEAGSDRTNPDSDGDGLGDGAEVDTHGTDPTNPDSDGGEVPDGEEVDAGTDPLDPEDDLPSYYAGGCKCDGTGGSGWTALLAAFGLLAVRRRK
jgi:MYXO-CTERM domain-containing protein